MKDLMRNLNKSSNKNIITTLIPICVIAWNLSACTKSASSSNGSVAVPGTETTTTTTTTIAPTVVQSKYLYVASGACYGGGVTSSAGIGTVVKYNLDTGSLHSVVMDYNTASPGDLPVAIQDYDTDHFLVLVENTAGRRVDIVNKDGSGYTSYLTNATALSAVLRGMALLTDGSLLVSKSSAIEKFNNAKARITVGANPYINAPGSSCATTNTLASSLIALSNGKILYTHAAASPNNKTVLISAEGYNTTADCLTTQAAPATTALPTAALIHSSGQLLIAYGSTTNASNSIYAYDLDVSTNVIANATAAFSDFSTVMGPSAIAENTATGDVFVANAISTYNNVEKFSYSSSTKTLTRAAGLSFIGTSAFTRCVSAMAVMY